LIIYQLFLLYYYNIEYKNTVLPDKSKPVNVCLKYDQNENTIGRFILIFSKGFYKTGILISSILLFKTNIYKSKEMIII